MKKTKLILTTLVITLCGVFAFFGKVNADEIDTVYFTPSQRAIVGEPFVTEGTTDVPSVSAEITKWYAEIGRAHV